MKDTQPLVLGTAGHIDHGKTALVTLLTGTNTDRLREERERGISIELGYAELTLPSGRHLSVVDVPGHERFVRTMVAGATGVDLFLLVVAADDGVMPQTREHLAVIELLGVERGVVAVTKADLVDDELVELVREDVADFLESTRYAGSPIVTVSSRDGRGIPELLDALEKAAEHVQAGSRDGPARLPVDRVFTLHGIGTVATGTLWRGPVRPGDMLVVQPGGHEVVVRTVQVHDRDAEEGLAGQRVALNLRGAERTGLERGRWLAAPHPPARVTRRFDAVVRLLPSAAPLKSGQTVRLHHGTAQHVARLQLLGVPGPVSRPDLSPMKAVAPAESTSSLTAAAKAEPAGLPDAAEQPGPAGLQELAGGRGVLQPGSEALVRVRLEDEVLVEPHDRFILRLLTPMTTIGGGTVLDAEAGRWRDRSALAAFLAALHTGDVIEAARLAAARRRPGTAAVPEGVAAAELESTTVGAEAAKLLARTPPGESPPRLRKAGLEALDGERFYPAGTGELLAGRIQQVLKERAAARPDRPTATAAEIAAATGARERAVARVLTLLGGNGQAIEAPAGWAAPGAGALDEAGERLAEQVADYLAVAGLTVPPVAALSDELRVDRKTLQMVLEVLVRRGLATRLKEDLWLATPAVDAAREQLLEALAGGGSVTLAGYRDLAGCGRRTAQALLESFDREGLTLRQGEERVLRKSRR